MRLYPLLFALLSFIGCRKQMIAPSSPIKDYERVTSLPDKNIINSTLEHNRLYIMHDQTVSILETDGSQTDLNFEGSNQVLCPMNPDFFVCASWGVNNELRFYSTKNPVPPHVKSFVPKDLGLTEIALFPSHFGCSAVNDRHQCLIVAHLNEDYTESALFLFEVKMSPDGLIDYVTYKPVTLPFKYRATFVSAVGSSFIVSDHVGATLLVNSNGHAQKVWDTKITDVLPIGDAYYGDTYNGIVKSEDMGLNWKDVTNTIANWQTGGLYLWDMRPQLANIDGHYVMFSNKLHEVRQGANNSLDNGELDRAGLGETYILNVHEWQGKVFVVTRTGIFTRSLSDFFTPAL